MLNLAARLGEPDPREAPNQSALHMRAWRREEDGPAVMWRRPSHAEAVLGEGGRGSYASRPSGELGKHMGLKGPELVGFTTKKALIPLNRGRFKRRGCWRV